MQCKIYSAVYVNTLLSGKIKTNTCVSARRESLLAGYLALNGICLFETDLLQRRTIEPLRFEEMDNTTNALSSVHNMEGFINFIQIKMMSNEFIHF